MTTGGPSWRAAAAGEPPAPRALTAEDGGFELVGVAPGERFLVASAEGFAGSEPARLALAPGEQRTDVELALREGGVLSGEVYGRDGAPAAGAVVQLVSSPAFDVILGRTDERGRFAFEHLAAGTWQVLGLPAAERMQSIASNQGDSESTLMGEMTVAIVEVRDGDAEHVVLGAPPTEPLHLTGRVLAGDRGLPAAVLGFFKEGRDVAASTTRAATDEDGRFAIVLDGPGRYVVAIVRNLGGALGESQLELPLVLGAGDAQDVVLALPTGSVSGVLLDAAGAPAPDTRVTLSESGPSATDLLNSRHHTQTRSDAEGRFRFDFVPGGEYLLAAGGMVSGGLFEHSAAFGRVVLHVDVPEGAAVEVPPIALDAPVSGRVRVVDGNGRPVKGAAVFARGADGQLVECTALLTSDDAGQCEYRGLVPGAYTFSARWRDLASSESAPVDLRGGASDEVVLELQEATELVVQLRDGDGRPTAGLVTLLDDQGRELQRMTSLHEVLRASDGTLFDTSELRLGPLPPGRYRVEATDGVHSDRRPLTLDGRTERKLTLRLR
ncbi:MAG: carboxypeptidase regulatory-like domain-containing protein [Planctomycetes bacterium]|nr:carboxypeptidase regulatory-like domain-containing protein [Planctomycetota bacterium]